MTNKHMKNSQHYSSLVKCPLKPLYMHYRAGVKFTINKMNDKSIQDFI